MEGAPLPAVAPGQVAPASAPTSPGVLRDTLLTPGASRRLRAAVAVGAVLTVVGALASPASTFPNVLIAAMFVLGIALAGALLVAGSFVTNAGWMTAIRRAPEAMAGALPIASCFVVLAVAGMPWLYEWSHADVVAHDPILQGKSAWLSPGFFVVRTLIVLAVWIAFATALRHASQAQDRDGDVAHTHRLRRLSAVFLIVFGLTFSMATFDWIMSIEAHWFSTVFALYQIAGVVLAGLAALTLLLLALRRTRAMRHVIRDDHLHDIGKLMFGFSIFWAYLWFCQHMLIWYGDLPEETGYYLTRIHGGWGPFFTLNLAVNWLIPFLALIARPPKRSWITMRNVAILLLFGRWLDLWMMVQPPLSPEGPVVSLWAIGPMLAAVCLTVLVIVRRFEAVAPVPTGDPYLDESLHHST